MSPPSSGWRDRVGDLLDAYGRFAVRHRLAMLLATLLLTGIGLATASHRVITHGPPLDFTPQAMFMDEGPSFTRLAEIEEVFGRDDNDLIILVEGPLGTIEGIAALRALHATLQADPDVHRVDSPVTAQLPDSDGGMLTPLTPMDELPPAEAIAALGAAPETGGLLVSPDGQVAAMRARIDPKLDRIADLAPAIHRIVAAVDATPLPDGMRTLPVGVPYIRTDVVDLMLADQQRFLPLVAGMFAMTTIALFRRVRLGIAPLISVLFADMWAVALLINGGAVFTVLSILVPTLVLIIGVADGVHLTARYREEFALDAHRERAMGKTMRAMTLPCFLTTFTTAAGFASLVVAETRVVREFGLHCAIAMMVCFFAVIITLPAVLAWVPAHRVHDARTGRSPIIERGLAAVARVVRDRPGTVLFATLLVTALAAVPGIGVRTNSALLEMYQEGTRTWDAVHLAEDHLGGVIPVFFHIQGPPDSALEPDNLQRMAALTDVARAEPSVLWARAFSDDVGRLHELLTHRPGLPSTREAAAQELLVADMAGLSPTGRTVSEDGSRARIQLLMSDAGGLEYLAMERRVMAEATRIYAGSGLTVELTGDGMLGARGVDRLIGDLLGSLGLVFVVIFGTMMWLLRDLRLAAMATLPNMLPLVFTVGTLGLLGADLQTSNIVSFTIAVGLAVDDTIHFVVRYRAERLAGRDPDDAVRRTLLGAGQAIVLTSVLLVLGFSVLTMSSLTSTVQFGLLASVTMGAALLADLFMLPAMLLLTERARAAPT